MYKENGMFALLVCNLKYNIKMDYFDKDIINNSIYRITHVVIGEQFIE